MFSYVLKFPDQSQAMVSFGQWYADSQERLDALLKLMDEKEPLWGWPTASPDHDLERAKLAIQYMRARIIQKIPKPAKFRPPPGAIL